jgi:hypothetical protein
MAKGELTMDDNQIIENEVVENESEQMSEPSDNVQDFLEIKYNKESLTLDREKAVELAQKGMNYEKAIERTRQEARDSYIAEQGYEWNGRAITTEAEYHEALREQELQQSYQEQDIPEEIIQELVENKRFREKYESEQQQKMQRSQQEQDFQTFLNEYPDVKAEEIPINVWREVEQGRSLVDAYMRHENQLLKQRLGVTEKNQQNAMSSVGAVRSNGATLPFYSREQVSKMSNAEVNANWKTINESMKKW